MGLQRERILVRFSVSVQFPIQISSVFRLILGPLLVRLLKSHGVDSFCPCVSVSLLWTVGAAAFNPMECTEKLHNYSQVK